VELVADEKKVRIRGNPKKSVTLHPGQSLKVMWDIEILPAVSGASSVRLTFRSDGDGLKTDLPVKNPPLLHSLAGAGKMTENWTGKIAFPENIFTSSVPFSVMTSGLPTALMERAAAALYSDTDETAELVISRLMADLAIDKIGNRFSDKTFFAPDAVTARIKSAAKSLMDLQRPDGGSRFSRCRNKATRG